MQIFNEIITNKCICVPILLWFAIQVFKFLTELIINRRINFRRIVGAGGMPSSHSAIVCAVSVLVGKEYGFGSGVFGLAIIMSFIVMYDAAGVRRAAGKQAAVLNKILENPELSQIEMQERLVELLGHTPFQVVVGAILGFVVGALV